MSSAPTLVFAVGNPSRGDDALGPRLLERLALRLGQRADVELLTDFQLQVEHALDLAGRERVIFVDASVDLREPFRLSEVAPSPNPSAFSHAMSPGDVLAAARRLGLDPPKALVLAIRGERFELGDDLSAAAEENLALAEAALLEALG